MIFMNSKQHDRSYDTKDLCMWLKYVYDNDLLHVSHSTCAFIGCALSFVKKILQLELRGEEPSKLGWSSSTTQVLSH